MTYMFDPDFSDDDIMNTAVDILPGVDFVVSETKEIFRLLQSVLAFSLCCALIYDIITLKHGQMTLGKYAV